MLNLFGLQPAPSTIAQQTQRANLSDIPSTTATHTSTEAISENLSIGEIFTNDRSRMKRTLEMFYIEINCLTK